MGCCAPQSGRLRGYPGHVSDPVHVSNPVPDTAVDADPSGASDTAGSGGPPVATDTYRDLARVDREKVHPLVRATAEWTWRLLLIAAGAYVLVLIFREYQVVIVPVALAILGTAMLVPLVDFLDRRHIPRSLAVMGTTILAIGGVVAVLSFVVRAFVAGLPELTAEVTDTVERSRTWLSEGPLDINPGQVGDMGAEFVNLLQQNQERLTTGAIATASTATEIVTGFFLGIFLLIFFLYGGGQIWRFVTGIIPSGSRERVHRAGVLGFGTLVGYVRATVAVAFVDACGIGIGLAILQVPLALPLASLVFLGAFVPIVGALVSGSLAVLIALVTKGWLVALIVLAIVVGVMQVESHVLQPFLLGRSVRLHPVAVVLAITAGIVFAGIVGGLLAVPLIAFANTTIRYLRSSAAEAAAAARDADDGMYSAKPDAPRWDRDDPDEREQVAAGVESADPDDPHHEPGR